MTPQELQDMLDELEASRSSRRRAWENLIRWVVKDTCGIDLPAQARKTIDGYPFRGFNGKRPANRIYEN